MFNKNDQKLHFFEFRHKICIPNLSIVDWFLSRSGGFSRKKCKVSEKNVRFLKKCKVSFYNMYHQFSLPCICCLGPFCHKIFWPAKIYFGFVLSILYQSPGGYPGEINNNSSCIKPPDGASGSFLFSVGLYTGSISLIIIV